MGRRRRREYAISVYRYPDAAAYVAALQETLGLPAWSSAARDRYHESTEGLEAVATLSAKPMELEYDRYLVLPEPLPAGYYLAEVQRDGQVRQVRFQVTDLSYYLAESTTGVLAWLNDLETGRPAAGAALHRPDGSPAATAGQDGVALLGPDLPARAEQKPRLRRGLASPRIASGSPGAGPRRPFCTPGAAMGTGAPRSPGPSCTGVTFTWTAPSTSRRTRSTSGASSIPASPMPSPWTGSGWSSPAGGTGEPEASGWSWPAPTCRWSAPASSAA